MLTILVDRILNIIFTLGPSLFLYVDVFVLASNLSLYSWAINSVSSSGVSTLLLKLLLQCFESIPYMCGSQINLRFLWSLWILWISVVIHRIMGSHSPFFSPVRIPLTFWHLAIVVQDPFPFAITSKWYFQQRFTTLGMCCSMVCL